MTYCFNTHALRTTVLTLLVGTMLGTAVFAQRPSPPPPRGRFGGPGGPFGGPGGPGRGMRGPRPSALADTPMAALSAGLKLTAAQQAKIAKIQAQYRAQRGQFMPRPGGPPPPPESMRGLMDKMRGLDQSTAAQIKTTLTSSQKAALPGLLKTFDDLRFAGIPLETYSALNLRPSQKAQIAAFVQSGQQTLRTTMDRARQTGDFKAIRAAMRTGRDQVMQKTDSVLTPTQKAVVAHYKAGHPRPERGGGFGPPPPGGRFGPPPPPGRR
jgi:Spy/CpxP family protein refolding chaperone